MLLTLCSYVITPLVVGEEGYSAFIGDIWAVGMTLYLWVFGKLPFMGEGYEVGWPHQDKRTVCYICFYYYVLLLCACSLEEGALLFFIKAKHTFFIPSVKELFTSIRSDKLDIGDALGPELR